MAFAAKSERPERREVAQGDGGERECEGAEYKGARLAWRCLSQRGRRGGGSVEGGFCAQKGRG